MQQNYEKLVEKIARISGLNGEEIIRKIEAKRARLSGLISKEGAAQVVAAELGINFDKEKVKINELVAGMKKVNLLGEIIRVFPIRTYTRKTNEGQSEGKVLNIVVADETSNIKTVLWDMNHIALFEQGKINGGDVIEILNGSVRNMELHLTAFSEIKKSSEQLEGVKTERAYNFKKIVDIKTSENVRIRAIILQMFEPRLFEVCPECNSRVYKESDSFTCGKHGKIMPLKRALVNIVLDDGSNNVRAVLFSEQINKLTGLDPESEDFLVSFMSKRKELLGKEAFFSGQMRQNKMFGNKEIFVEDIGEINLDKLIQELEQGKII